MMTSLFAFSTLASRTVKVGDSIVNCSTVADNYRSLADIIWSCLSTILLCTWVLLHPNVPKPVDEVNLSKLQWCAHMLRTFFKDQVLPFVLLLVAPEWVLMWALRQRLVVEYMVRTGKVPTRRHGFFIIMGGLHKFSRVEISATSDNTSTGSGVEKRHTDKTGEEEYGEPDHPLDRFDVCRLVEDGRLRLPPGVEIDDKSKSDWIAKSLVVGQTLWFVVQCIAHKIEGLPLTELEVVTIGYAVLNLVIYVIWWDKPQKVGRPICVFCGELHERNAEQKRFKWKMEAGDVANERFSAPVFGQQDNYVDLRSVKQTPTFHSGNPPRGWPFKLLPLEYFAMMVMSVIGGLFGAIHFLAWSSLFPTYKLLVLWRYGSILMTAAPFPTLIGFDNSFVRFITNWIVLPLLDMFRIVVALLFLLPVAYVIGRVITLVVTFQTLSSLPPEAFQSVQWTDLFAHI
ncbi:hypothetical protein FRC14_004993 [Serendipita sp. 396]|nr:hypothetical protein FRC14_004993 [Serendipita sp. 396]